MKNMLKPAFPEELGSIQAVPIEQWGRDHWSTFGYIETRIVDHNGEVHRAHMRCNAEGPQKKTRLAGGLLHPNGFHDDYHCLEDAVAAGLLVHAPFSTGLNPRFALTERGREVAAKLRAHKGSGGSFATFILASN